VKRFEFPLERVRRFRAEQADVEELKLQQLRAELSRLQGAQRQIQADVAASARETLAQASLEAVELTSLESYRLHMRRRLYDLENLARQCEGKIVEQRQRVIEARRQYELLDRLHHKALQEWRAASNKEQEDLAAELFLAKSVRDRARPG
jgi:flagellar FliJ protein